MISDFMLNMGAGKSLSPIGTKPLPEPMLSHWILHTQFSEIWIKIHFFQQNAFENVHQMDIFSSPDFVKLSKPLCDFTIVAVISVLSSTDDAIMCQWF